MKLYFLIVLSGLLGHTFCPDLINLSQKTTIISCDKIPELNQKIIVFVDSKMSKKVGRGECWDLAAEALNSVGASWDKDFKFGQEIDPKKDCVYPGDIMQFTNVTVEYAQGNKRFRETMAQHTAIIYKVNGTGDYVIADQNTSMHGKKVGLNPLELKNISKGRYQVYRPVK
ncbi:MAG: hypothetical protein V4635_10640 [Bacteroidota bacterium]